jgi:ABC-type iron transport system FetAB ATPase subunit
MARLSLHSFHIDQLAPIDLEVQAGECITLTGPSGSGKTLLLRAIADLDPHRGEAQFNGTTQVQTAPPEWRRAVGFLPAESQWWTDQVGDHFPAIDTALLKALGFESECLEWQVSRLSSGERQRLGLARLLSNQPKVLLLDEPTANLDKENGRRVEQIIHDYQQQHQTPVLWVSHDEEQQQRVGSRHFHIQQGRLEAVTWS